MLIKIDCIFNICINRSAISNRFENYQENTIQFETTQLLSVSTCVSVGLTTHPCCWVYTEWSPATLVVFEFDSKSLGFIKDF